jgi:Cys-rich protein (TIGR01571 family)
MDYTNLNKGEWSSHLCTCDIESCFLSCCLPCHVYAKIRSLGSKCKYCIHLIVYMSLYVSMQQFWYSNQYLNSHTCPANLIDNCITITDNCETNYMMVDNLLSACVLKNNICVYDTIECVSHKDSNEASLICLIFTSIGYMCLVFLHYIVREQIKSKQNISGNIIEDVMAVTCCSTCGLAQEYREL